ncbi:MAG: hypothetical protein N2691_02675 [Patescibacteria group bacterium]|nr:hypothetical protein [Patescibacteria group bacterium]
MNSTPQNTSVVSAIIIAVGIVGAAFLISSPLGAVGNNLKKLNALVEKAVRNEALDGCYQAARVSSVSTESASIVIPESSWLEICLKEKGYR